MSSRRNTVVAFCRGFGRDALVALRWENSGARCSAGGVVPIPRLAPLPLTGVGPPRPRRLVPTFEE